MPYCNFMLLVLYACVSNVGGYGLAKKKKKKRNFNAIEQDYCEQGCYMKGKYLIPFP